MMTIRPDVSVSLDKKFTRRLEKNGATAVRVGLNSTGTLDARQQRIEDRRTQSRSVSIVATETNPLEGESVTFNVLPTFERTPSYQWYLDGIAIGGETSSAYTRTMQSADHGLVLSCVVTDEDNSDEGTLDLVVIPFTIMFDPSVNVFQETSGALGGLTPSATGDPVGTWADTTGTYIFRAPASDKRMTLRSEGGVACLEKSNVNQYYQSADAASSWNFLHNGTSYCVFNASKPTAGTTDCWNILENSAGSSTYRGVWFQIDNRKDVLATLHTSGYCSVNNGTTAVVRMINRTGQEFGNWRKDLWVLDPDNATARLRGKYYSHGRPAQDNTFTGTPSASNASLTLRIYGTHVSDTWADSSLGFGAEVIIYQGTWDESQIKSLNARFNYNAIDYQEIVKRSNVAATSSNHTAFPHLAISNYGNLFVSFRRGSAHTSGDGRGYIAKSEDDGASWTEFPLYSEYGRDFREAPIFFNQSGELVALVTSRSGTDSNQRINVFKSLDGRNWSESLHQIDAPSGFDYIFAHNTPFWFNNRWGVFFYSRNTATSLTECRFYTSSDGITWSYNATPAGNSQNNNEAAVINTGGDNLLAFIRGGVSTADRGRFSTSTDNGATWTTTDWSDDPIQGVQPTLIKLGETVYAGATDRDVFDTNYQSICFYPYADGEFHGNEHAWFWHEADQPPGYGAGQRDIGHNDATVFNGFLYVVFYDNDPSESGYAGGVNFAKLRYPKING